MLIWERPERSARGPRPAHSRAQAAAAAIAIADAEGIEAVSMRRVAAEIGAGTTSLYRYLSKKDELFDLMLDAVIGEDEPAPPTGDWRADLRAIAHRHRAMIRRHPWMAMVSAGRPILGPNSLRTTEHALTVVDGLGLDIDTMMIVVDTLLAFVRGHTMKELAEYEAHRRSGMDFAAYIQGQAEYGYTVVASGRFPTLTRFWVEAKVPHAANRDDLAFELGLDRVLDGFASSMSAD